MGKHTMTPDQIRLLGGPERLASINRRIARERVAIMSGQPVYPGSAVHDDDDDLGEDATAVELASAARKHLEVFLASPDAEDAADQLGYASALMATALSRCARNSMHRQRGRY